MGEYAFSGQYQQNPVPRDGGIIKKKWFKFYNREELFKSIENRKLNIKGIIQSWDTANKIEEHNDYSVCITMLVDNNFNKYVLNCYREKLEFPDLIRKVTNVYKDAKQRYPYKIDVLIEDKASGTQIIQSLKDSYYIYPIAIKPEIDKESRLRAVSHLIENGSCLFPNDNPYWWSEFERELLRFPRTKHQDQCDALSQALNHKLKVSIFDVL